MKNIFHELSNILPLILEEELLELAENIKKNGLLEPTTLYEGKILDYIFIKNGYSRHQTLEL